MTSEATLNNQNLLSNKPNSCYVAWFEWQAVSTIPRASWVMSDCTMCITEEGHLFWLKRYSVPLQMQELKKVLLATVHYLLSTRNPTNCILPHMLLNHVLNSTLYKRENVHIFPKTPIKAIDPLWPCSVTRSKSSFLKRISEICPNMCFTQSNFLHKLHWALTSIQ